MEFDRGSDSHGHHHHAPPGSVPDHELLRRIGRGSYGDVWLCRNQLGTYRAVKFIQRHVTGNERAAERELAGIRNFEPVSRSHEGLVDVLHVGITSDYYYCIMELADDRHSGQNIDPENYVPKTLERKVLSVTKVVDVGLRICSALQHLHSANLVHRDIKPSNIIFVDGSPKLADIGLVAEAGGALSIVGTEGFLPPEGPGTPQADLFALGKVLYEISTGMDRREFPALPFAIDQTAEAHEFLELNEIILRACEPRSARRFQTAQDMLKELKLVELGQSVRRMRQLERYLAAWKRWTKVALVAGALIAAGLFAIEQNSRRRAEARQRVIGTHISNGIKLAEEGNLIAALPPLVRVLQLDPDSRPIHGLRVAGILQRIPALIAIWNHGSRVNDLHFNPQGNAILTALLQKEARVWDIASGNPITSGFATNADIDGVCFSPDGQQVVVCGQSEATTLHSAVTGITLFTLTDTNGAFDADYSPDGQQVITAGRDGIARTWSARTGDLLTSFVGHTRAIRFATFSHDGTLVATASTDHTVRIWNARTAELVAGPLEHPSWVYHVQFSADDSQILTSCFDQMARVWELKTGDVIPPPLPHPAAVHRAEYSPDGRFILTACWDGTARLWMAKSHEPALPNAVLPHRSKVMQATFGPDGHRVATSTLDGTVCIWDLAPSVTLPLPVHGIWSDDHSRIMAFSGTTITVRDARSRLPIAQPFDCPELDAAKLDATGRFVLAISGSNSNQISVWEVATGRRLAAAIPHRTDLANLCLSPDGRRLALAKQRTVQLYDVISGSMCLPEFTHEHSVRKMFFDRHGKRLFTLCNRRVYVRDVATGDLLFEELTEDNKVKHVELSGDGRYLALCTEGVEFSYSSAQIYDAYKGTKVGARLQHEDGVQFAAFSPDNRLLITGGQDFRASVWEVKTGRRILRLSLPHQVLGTAFTPDATAVLTVCRNGTARLWELATGQPLLPPLWHFEKPNAGWCDTASIFTRAKSGHSWQWPLPQSWPDPDDLSLLAALLGNSGEASLIDPASVVRAEDLPSLWTRLRLKHPAEFEVDAEELTAWQRFHATNCEQEKDWRGAVFHLTRLNTLHPDNTEVAARLRHAHEQFRK